MKQNPVYERLEGGALRRRIHLVERLGSQSSPLQLITVSHDVADDVNQPSRGKDQQEKHCKEQQVNAAL